MSTRGRETLHPGRETGMTLVEVLLALGLMATVLISIASLFVLGGQRVKGSRNMTQGMALATDVLEELYDVGINTLPETFPDCCSAGCDAVTSCTVTSDSDTFLQSGWRSWLEEEFSQGRIEVTLTSVGGPDSPPTFSSSEGIQLHVQVYWHEGTSERSASQETVLF